MPKLSITWVKSGIGYADDQKKTLKAQKQRGKRLRNLAEPSQQALRAIE